MWREEKKEGEIKDLGQKRRGQHRDGDADAENV